MRTEKFTAVALTLLAIYRLRGSFPLIADLSGVAGWDVADRAANQWVVNGSFSTGDQVTVFIEKRNDELYISAIRVIEFRGSIVRCFRFVYQEYYPESTTGWDEIVSIQEMATPAELGNFWLSQANFI